MTLVRVVRNQALFSIVVGQVIVLEKWSKCAVFTLSLLCSRAVLSILQLRADLLLEGAIYSIWLYLHSLFIRILYPSYRLIDAWRHQDTAVVFNRNGGPASKLVAHNF